MASSDDHKTGRDSRTAGAAAASPKGEDTAAVTFLKKTFDHLPEGLAAFDEQYRLAYWNDRYFELMDYPPELAVRGTPFIEFLMHNARGGEYGPGDPEEQVRVRMLPEHLLDERDFVWPRGSGRILRLRRSPVPGGGLLVAVSDITDEKRQELRQMQSELRLKLLSESVDEALVIHDGSSVVDANEAALRMFDASRDQLTGKRLSTLFAPESRSSLEAILDSDEENPRELLGERENGSTFPLELVSRTIPSTHVRVYAPLVLQPGGKLVELSDTLHDPDLISSHSHILLPDGRLVMLSPAERDAELAKQSSRMLLLRDLTERKAAEAERQHVEQQLHQAQKLEAVGTLAGGIAHDFNNILSAVVGYAELLTTTIPADSRAHDYGFRILTAGNRARELINQMLTFSRQRPSERRTVDLPSVIEEALVLIRASLPATVEIHTRFADDTPPVFADPTQIHQVLMNLCTNAHHAMPDGGLLEIVLDAMEVDRQLSFGDSRLDAGRYARIAIADSGHGIASNDVDRIFDPFFTTKEVGVGTGLGLSIVHGIVTAHAGAIHVESESNKGTTFHVYLPAATSEGTGDVQHLSRRPRGSGESILVVDDEQPLLELLEEMLEQIGYKAICAPNGKAALEIIRDDAENLDLIVTDLTMHGMTGIALADEIRRIDAGLPIILVTGYSDKDVAGDARAAGIQEILSKPLRLDELAESVARVLAANSRSP